MGETSQAPDRAVFAISVAADLARMQIQNLRVYERRGLVSPARTPGGSRLYSEADVARLRRIGELLGEGLNLAGIARVLVLEEELRRLRASNSRLRAAARE
ncbi:MAG: MerR family transcriptional regulator [Nocardioides sp.]|nr:MerR family transcriptional regulator [Nocardioides sp.]